MEIQRFMRGAPHGASICYTISVHSKEGGEGERIRFAIRARFCDGDPTVGVDAQQTMPACDAAHKLVYVRERNKKKLPYDQPAAAATTAAAAAAAAAAANSIKQLSKVMFCRVCGFRVRVWESYRTSRSFGYGYGCVTELTEVPGIVARAYRTQKLRVGTKSAVPVPRVLWHGGACRRSGYGYDCLLYTSPSPRD